MSASLRTSLRRAALLVSIAGGAGLIAGGCGHCDGAVRRMRAQLADCRGECPEPPQEQLTIRPTETFRIGGDGPKADSELLLSASGVDVDTWFLVAEASGEVVPATIVGDAGGHSCRYGVGFNLVPEAPLASGDYTLVLRLDALSWPHVGRDPYGGLSTFEGAPALVRRFRVVE